MRGRTASKSSLGTKISREEQKRRSRDRHVNHLLLRIILAHPDPTRSTTPEQRLARAREALLGVKSSSGRPSQIDDYALFHMNANQRKGEMDSMMRALRHLLPDEVRTRWDAIISRDPESIHAIATRMAEEGLGQSVQSQSSYIDRLRRKAADLNLTTQDMADIEGLIYGNSDWAHRIETILDGLNRLGIPSKVPLGYNTGN